MVYANSITLTPGTITVETQGDHFLVHALDFGDGDMGSAGRYGRARFCNRNACGWRCRMMFLVATIALFIGMALVLIRLYAGPTLYDRVLAGNAFGTYTVLFIGVLGFLMGRPDFLDIALLYALINFVGTIAVLKFFRYRGDRGYVTDATGRTHICRSAQGQGDAFMSAADLIIEILSWACIVSGSAFMLIGAIGTLRFPDFWARFACGIRNRFRRDDTVDRGHGVAGRVLPGERQTDPDRDIPVYYRSNSNPCGCQRRSGFRVPAKGQENTQAHQIKEKAGQYRQDKGCHP